MQKVRLVLMSRVSLMTGLLLAGFCISAYGENMTYRNHAWIEGDYQALQSYRQGYFDGAFQAGSSAFERIRASGYRDLNALRTLENASRAQVSAAYGNYGPRHLRQVERMEWQRLHRKWKLEDSYNNRGKIQPDYGIYYRSYSRY